MALLAVLLLRLARAFVQHFARPAHVETQCPQTPQTTMSDRQPFRIRHTGVGPHLRWYNGRNEERTATKQLRREQPTFASRSG
jgi:hypothetical protein